MGMVKIEAPLAALRAALRLPEDVEIVGAYMYSETPTKAASAVTLILSGDMLPQVVRMRALSNGAHIPDPEIVSLESLQVVQGVG